MSSAPYGIIDEGTDISRWSVNGVPLSTSLGYTSVNKAGDTMTGSLLAPGLSPSRGLFAYSGAGSVAGTSWIYAVYGAQGTVTGNATPLNLIQIADNTANTTVGGITDALRVSMATGAAAQGKKTAITALLQIDAIPANPSATTGLYAALIGDVTAAANVGGANGANIGTYWGLNAVVRTGAAATFLEGTFGAEIDTEVVAGASTNLKNGIRLVQTTLDAVRGSQEDVAIQISNQPNAARNAAGGAGWTYGLSFGGPGSSFPMSSTGTLIAAVPNTLFGGPYTNNLTCDKGIDFAAMTFTTSAIATPSFTVDGSGHVSCAQLAVTGNTGFYGTTPVAKPTVTGSRGGNAALASLLTALAAQGLITDSSS